MIDQTTNDPWWSFLYQFRFFTYIFSRMSDSDVHRGVPNETTEESFLQPKIKTKKKITFFFHMNCPSVSSYRKKQDFIFDK